MEAQSNGQDQIAATCQIAKRREEAWALIGQMVGQINHLIKYQPTRAALSSLMDQIVI